LSNGKVIVNEVFDPFFVFAHPKDGSDDFNAVEACLEVELSWQMWNCGLI
jgi:hypothetical protein